MRRPERRAVLASACVYVALTLVTGRHVLANISTTIANDAGDPLLTAAILHWNAHHLPYTDAWWQFPIFAPTPDALAFSEHLLGLSPIATPINWLTGDAAITYNLVVLLTFPLCALAAYALAWRLTRSAPAAFLAGLAFGFGPYRTTELGHIQMLATFWAPLALLGLHAYVDTRRRRWLALYALSWMFLAMTNGYFLVYLSVLVGLWVAWFVIPRRDWQALAGIAGTTILAALPLVPILLKYRTVHALHGLERSVAEVEAFSADVAAVLCASHLSTFWSWVRVRCSPEGELFPGVTLPIVIVLGLATLAVLRMRRATPTAAAGGHALGFYLSSALVLWALTLGPSVRYMGRLTAWPGPFLALMQIPGVTSLRAPERFWLLALLALVVAMGILVRGMLVTRSRPTVVAVVFVLALGLVGDGWTSGINAAPAPAPVPDALAIRGGLLVRLPPGEVRDVEDVYRAVLGGWRSVNGYSGNAPTYYPLVVESSRADEDGLLRVFRGLESLSVLVADQDKRLQELVERAGGHTVARNTAFVRYDLPRADAIRPTQPAGRRIPLTATAATCQEDGARLATDGRLDTSWSCRASAGEWTLTLDAGHTVTMSQAVYRLGPNRAAVPWRLRLETSLDGTTWQVAWADSPLSLAIASTMQSRTSLDLVFTFPRRDARFIRVTNLTVREGPPWEVVELEAWSG